MRKVSLVLVIISAVIFSACNKSTEVLDLPALNDYYPLQVGKYVTYSLDSTVYINFGTKDTVIKYQVKHQIDGTLTWEGLLTGLHVTYAKQQPKHGCPIILLWQYQPILPWSLLKIICVF